MKHKLAVSIILIQALSILAMCPLFAQTFLVKEYEDARRGSHSPDDGPAIRRAVADAVAYTRQHPDQIATVRFETGKTYILAKRLDSPSQIELLGVERLRLVGSNTTLVTHPNNVHISLWRCKDVEVSGFILDMNPLPYTQGTIFSKDEGKGSFDFRIDDGYEDPYVGEHSAKDGQNDVTFYYSNGDHRQNWVNIDSVAHLDGFPDHTFRTFAVEKEFKKLQKLDIGDKCVIKLLNKYPLEGERKIVQRNGETSISGAGNIEIWKSSDITIKNTTSYASRVQTLHTFGCSDILIDRFCFLPKPGTRNLLGSTKGGVILRESVGSIIVSNCYLESASDDLAACSERPLNWKLVSQNQIVVNDGWYPWDQSIGWEMIIFDPAKTKVKGTVRITAASEVNGETFKLELAESAYEQGYSSLSSTDLLYVKRKAPIRFVNTVFTNGLKKGIIARGATAIVYCIFSKLAFGIHHYHKPGPGQGGPHPYGLLVENCRFKDIRIACIQCWNGGDEAINVPSDGNIRNNTFIQAFDGHGVQLVRQNGTEVRDNSFIFDSSVPEQYKAISVTDCENCILTGNSGDRLAENGILTPKKN